jgi:hypothetical protein
MLVLVREGLMDPMTEKKWCVRRYLGCCCCCCGCGCGCCGYYYLLLLLLP